jgi:hypothetical protein
MKFLCTTLTPPSVSIEKSDTGIYDQLATSVLLTKESILTVQDTHSPP